MKMALSNFIESRFISQLLSKKQKQTEPKFGLPFSIKIEQIYFQ